MLHKMGLQKKYFDSIKNGIKRVEVRLNDEKRSKIKVGDIILFLEEPLRIENEGIETLVVDLKYYNDFQELIEDVPIEVLGTNIEKDKYLEDLNSYYSLEKQKQYGVVAIMLQQIIKKEKSCGAVVFRELNGELQVLLVHHNKGHWGSPKGHVEENEIEEETALREVREETGIEVKIIDGFRDVITYSPKEQVLKDVVFFVGEAKSMEAVPQLSEVQEACWVGISEALSLVTHQNENDVLKKAVDYYKEYKNFKN